MAQKMSKHLPCTVWSGVGTMIAVSGCTGLLKWIATFFEWNRAAAFLAMLGDPFFFALYGACAMVLCHHLTHYPTNWVRRALQILLGFIALWSLSIGVPVAGPLIIGIILGLAWLHWFHAEPVIPHILAKSPTFKKHH